MPSPSPGTHIYHCLSESTYQRTIYSFTLHVVYAPTLDADDATKEAFYIDVQQAINLIPRSDLLIAARPGHTKNITSHWFVSIE